MSFIVSVRSERLTAAYSAATVEEAVAKAESFGREASITITDPNHNKFNPNDFPLLLSRWGAPI